MQGSRGQNIIEYVLLVAAVLLVCIYFFSTHGGPMAVGINGSLNSIVNQVNHLSGQIKWQ